MDKIKRPFCRSVFLAVTLFFAILLSGCETVKGLGRDLASVPGNISTDARNTWDWLKGADRWMQDNLW
jgi:predicted small secreted protein